MIERLFLAVPWGCLRFVIVVFHDHTHLLFLKAEFKLTKCYSNMTPKLDTIIDLFEHTVEPVVLYGSEIWGTVNILSSKIKKAHFTLEHLFVKFLCDKLQIKCLKYISKNN